MSLKLQFRILTDFGGQMLSFDGNWHAGEVCSSQLTHHFNCTGQMADSMWASSMPMSML
jgi:hypothetical protein